MEQKIYDVFISYSRKDYVDEHNNVIPGNEVSKIKEALTKASITFWFDEEGLYFGEKFTEKITDNIEASQIFLFLSTKNACESPWTSKEIACADELGKYIIPVRIDKTPYNKKVLFRIADLSYIDYGKNPEKGRQEIVDSIKAHLDELKVAEEQRIANEKRRKEELELQRKRETEEKKRQEKIAKIETEIAALESQRTERKKAVLQKEQELKLAQVDLDECEAKIKKFQNKLQELREPKKKTGSDEKRFQKEADAKERVFNVENASFKMIRVEGGSMGTFYIGETQVTQALWQAVMGTTVQQQRDKADPEWPMRGEGDEYPMYYVNWNECQEFIRKLNSMTGKSFRLPKESEWEYAAKGGNKSNNYIYAGSDDIDKVAWYIGNSKNSTHPVKQLSANELGIYDMSGNVWEWCEDLYEPTSSYRVLRGGSWGNRAGNCRVSYRDLNVPDIRHDIIGFRLVLPQ